MKNNSHCIIKYCSFQHAPKITKAYITSANTEKLLSLPDY